MQCEFTATKTETALIGCIVDRIEKIAAAHAANDGVEYSRSDIHMDIEATHSNGCPLDLHKMLAAADVDLMHDAYGIRRHLNRLTGRLGGQFLPRCARPRMKAG